ncbi:MAG TPA: cation diffusion facilitator family transporter, partial [Allosphingosinicella sp.]
MAEHDNRTLLIAFAAKLGIAVSKFVAAAFTGSSAMLTEGVHSVVDSSNQLLLIWGRRQARKPADDRHPFGYGRELYFWSFVVAVMVFALGAMVSVVEGVLHILHPEEAVSPYIAYAVLLVAFLLEGGSTWAAFKEFKAAKGSLGWFEAVRRSKDPPGFIVLLENGAA